MKKYVISIDQEDCERLESLDYFSRAKSNILTHILTTKDLVVNDEMFSKYCDDYIETFTLYELTKNEISNKYLEFERTITDGIQWSIDFSRFTMTIIADLTDEQYQEVLNNARK